MFHRYRNRKQATVSSLFRRWNYNYLLIVYIMVGTISIPSYASQYNNLIRTSIVATSRDAIPSHCQHMQHRVGRGATNKNILCPLLSSLRGGQSADPNNYPNYDAGYDTSYDDPPPPPPMTSSSSVDDDPFHETVQQRVDNWRNIQRERSENLTPEQQANPRDEQGRLKLLVSVSKGSRAVVFFIMMWRDVFLYEVADQSLKGGIRLFLVVPLMLLFVANLVGILASLSSTSHQAKKRLKAILNLDKMMECFLMVWYFIRLTVAPSNYVPREVFIGNTLHSVFFFIQCQTVTRLSWDDVAAKPETSSIDVEYSDESAYGQDPLHSQLGSQSESYTGSYQQQQTNHNSY